MEIVTPRNQVLGKIEDLRLPHLTEMYDFHPAPLSKIIQVSGTGSLSLKPASGIPAQCIKDYFVAVDNHVSFLKDDLQFHMNAENQGGHHLIKSRDSRRMSYETAAILNQNLA